MESGRRQNRSINGTGPRCESMDFVFRTNSGLNSTLALTVPDSRPPVSRFGEPVSLVPEQKDEAPRSCRDTSGHPPRCDPCDAGEMGRWPDGSHNERPRRRPSCVRGLRRVRVPWYSVCPAASGKAPLPAARPVPRKRKNQRASFRMLCRPSVVGKGRGLMLKDPPFPC